MSKDIYIRIRITPILDADLHDYFTEILGRSRPEVARKLLRERLAIRHEDGNMALTNNTQTPHSQAQSSLTPKENISMEDDSTDGDGALSIGSELCSFIHSHKA